MNLYSGVQEANMMGNPAWQSDSAAARLAKRVAPRVGANLLQWFTRHVHEPDFELFKRVADVPGLMLDIGANRGHSAISVLRHTRRLRVLSLEPNPGLRWSLALLVLLHPMRFRFRLIGAGDSNQSAELLVPIGTTDLSSSASLDPREFDKDYVQERLAQFGHEPDARAFGRVPVRIRRLDDLRLAPDVIKLDIEGWEAQALRGLAATLAAAKPLLIIELNNSQRWAPYLQGLGYRFYGYEDGGLRHHPDWRTVPGLNVICVHPGSLSRMVRLLAREVSGWWSETDA